MDSLHYIFGKKKSHGNMKISISYQKKIKLEVKMRKKNLKMENLQNHSRLSNKEWWLVLVEPTYLDTFSFGLRILQVDVSRPTRPSLLTTKEYRFSVHSIFFLDYWLVLNNICHTRIHKRSVMLLRVSVPFHILQEDRSIHLIGKIKQYLNPKLILITCWTFLDIIIAKRYCIWKKDIVYA